MKINRNSLDTLIRNLNSVAMGAGTTYSVVQVGRSYAIEIHTFTRRGHAVDSGVPMTLREAYYAALGMLAGRTQESIEQATFAHYGTHFPNLK